MKTPASKASRKPGPVRAMMLMGVSYPLLAHVAALSGRPGLIAASIGWLLVLTLLPGLQRRSPAAWAALAAACVGLYAIAGSTAPRLLQLLPPVLMIGFMAWDFGHTLRRGRTPLIESIIRALNGPQDDLNEEIISYARRLTGVWTALLVVLAVVNTALALCAEPGGLLLTFGVQPAVTVPLSLWSLFANVLNYLLVAALFIGEFAFRRRRFPQQPYGGLLDFTGRVAGLA
ncbi:MAG: hypothetical protein MUO39_05900, partial [Steroidobacteraceae bacterium]|nr:hypothetical protein [Steroidobacteraceae bacterium]